VFHFQFDSRRILKTKDEAPTNESKGNFIVIRFDSSGADNLSRRD
jgi:hypothetical protein